MTEHDNTIESENTIETELPERFTFRKSARLRHRTMVEGLFAHGKSVYVGPLRVTYRTVSAPDLASSFREDIPDRIGPVQVMITVPKKKRRHAVDRVLMRRRIREAFRLQYRTLRRMVEESPDIRTLSLAVIYLEPSNLESEAISSAMGMALAKIMKKLGARAGATPDAES